MGAWAAITALTQHFGEVYKALGQTRIMRWMQAITTALTVPGLVWVAWRGLGLVAIVAVLIAVRVVRAVLDLIVMRELVDLQPAAALRSVAARARRHRDHGARGSRRRPRGPGLARAGAARGAHRDRRRGLCRRAGALDRGLLGEVRDLLRAAIGERALPGSDVEPSLR